MKVVTIHQPWAWLILAGHKRVENRTWSTSYRGPLAIHAGARRGAERQGWLDGGMIEGLRELGYPVPDPDELVYSAILGSVELVDCVDYRAAPRLPGFVDPYDLAGDVFAGGPKCWILDDPRPLDEPIPCPGKQGLWDVPDRRSA